MKPQESPYPEDFEQIRPMVKHLLEVLHAMSPLDIVKGNPVTKSWAGMGPYYLHIVARHGKLTPLEATQSVIALLLQWGCVRMGNGLYDAFPWTVKLECVPQFSHLVFDFYPTHCYK